MTNYLHIACALTLSVFITGCGFQLRGSQAPIFENPHIALSIVDKSIDAKSRGLLNTKLTQKLTALGANITQVQDSVDGSQTLMTKKDNTSVSISNINLKKHRLMGTLTEVQLLLTADIMISASSTTSSTTSAIPKQRQRKLMTQRSYQYNQQTVSTMEAEESRTIERMYTELAEKISHQVTLFESTTNQK